MKKLDADKVLEEVSGLWKGMKKGSVEFVRDIRKDSEKRLKNINKLREWDEEES